MGFSVQHGPYDLNGHGERYFLTQPITAQDA